MQITFRFGSCNGEKRFLHKFVMQMRQLNYPQHRLKISPADNSVRTAHNVGGGSQIPRFLDHNIKDTFSYAVNFLLGRKIYFPYASFELVIHCFMCVCSIR